MIVAGEFGDVAFVLAVALRAAKVAKFGAVAVVVVLDDDDEAATVTTSLVAAVAVARVVAAVDAVLVLLVGDVVLVVAPWLPTLARWQLLHITNHLMLLSIVVFLIFQI